MERQERAKVEEVQLVAVDQQKLVPEHRRGLSYGARGIQQLAGFVRVLDANAEARAVAEMVGNHAGEVMQIDHEIQNTLGFQMSDMVLEQRQAVRDRRHGLRDVVGNRPKPTPDSRSQDERFHL